MVLSDFVRAKIRDTVTDPRAAAILEPRTHPIVSKRPTVNRAAKTTTRTCNRLC